MTPVTAVNERREEFQWLAKKSGPYAGQWVALDGSRLVAHGDELAAVRAAARAAGVERPLLTHLPPEGELLFGGWQAMHQLTFTQVHSYADRDAGITVPVVLRSGETNLRSGRESGYRGVVLPVRERMRG